MSDPNEETRLSMLADGELDSDQMNQILLEVLDDEKRRGELKRLLLLRRAFKDWRSAEPTRTLTMVAHRNATPIAGHARHWIGLAAAAMLGGVLVMGGFWMAGRDRPIAQDIPIKDHYWPATVSPELRSETAAVFALHQSVAGPLDWYADDEHGIRMASSSAKLPTRRPVAMVLRLVPTSNGVRKAKNYLIVCRENTATTIELPADATRSDVPPLQLTLWVVPGEKGIDVQYALAAEDKLPAVLAGQREIGLETTRLGQLALGPRLFDVAANAWMLNEEQSK